MYYIRKKALTFCTRPRQEHFGQALVRVGVWTACGAWGAVLASKRTKAVRALNRAQKNTERVGVYNGAPGRIRTYNLLIRSQMLYPIELRAHRGNNTTPFFFRMQAFFIKIRKNYQITPRPTFIYPPKNDGQGLRLP